jgi:hypothetical protein
MTEPGSDAQLPPEAQSRIARYLAAEVRRWLDEQDRVKAARQRSDG